MNKAAGRHNQLARFDPDMRAEIIRHCTAVCLVHAADHTPCTDSGHACYTCQDAAAQTVNDMRPWLVHVEILRACSDEDAADYLKKTFLVRP